MPADVHDVMLATVVEVPLGRLYPGRISVQLDTLLPDAELPVPEGHCTGAMLDKYVPVLTVRLLIVVLVFRFSTPAAPGQNVAPVVHTPISLTAVVLPRAKGTA